MDSPDCSRSPCAIGLGAVEPCYAIGFASMAITGAIWSQKWWEILVRSSLRDGDLHEAIRYDGIGSIIAEEMGKYRLWDSTFATLIHQGLLDAWHFGWFYTTRLLHIQWFMCGFGMKKYALMWDKVFRRIHASSCIRPPGTRLAIVRHAPKDATVWSRLGNVKRYLRC